MKFGERRGGRVAFFCFFSPLGVATYLLVAFFVWPPLVAEESWVGMAGFVVVYALQAEIMCWLGVRRWQRFKCASSGRVERGIIWSPANKVAAFLREDYSRRKMASMVRFEGTDKISFVAANVVMVAAGLVFSMGVAQVVLLGANVTQDWPRSLLVLHFLVLWCEFWGDFILYLFVRRGRSDYGDHADR